MCSKRRIALMTGIYLSGLAWALAQQPGATTNKRPTASGEAGANIQASVPRLIRFRGILQNLAGKVISGPMDVTFSLYSDEAGGSALWYETQTVQADSLGYYTVLLGAMTPTGVPMELFTTGEAHWLGVQVGNLPEQPRVLLVSVPYAMKAGDAETLGGKPASAFVQITVASNPDSTATGSQTANSAKGKKQTTTKNSPTPQQVISGGTNFVDTTTDQVVGVTQNGTGLGILASASGNTAIQGTTTKVGTTIVSGLYGVATASSGPARGVTGLTNSTTGTGVFGYATAATGTTYGIAGQSSSTSGTGLRGDAVATSGSTIGLMGLSFSTSGTGIVGQENANSGNTTGILARIFSSSGTGLVINNIAGGKLFSGQNNGIEMMSFNATGGGYFLGNIGVGTSTPLSSLHVAAGDIVVGPVAALPYSSTNGFYVNNDSGDAKNTFRLDGYNNSLYIVGASASGSAAGTTLTFRTQTAGAGEKDQVRIDSSGRLGVGTNFPGHRLESNGSESSLGGFINNGGGADHTALVDLQNGEGNLWRVGVGGAGNGLGFTGGQFYIEESGSGEAFRIDTEHNIFFDGTVGIADNGGHWGLGGTFRQGGYALTVNGLGTSAHAISYGWDTFSSRRFKTNIHTLRGGLNKVERLRGVTYTDKSNGKPEVGVIAEEVAEVLPQVVGHDTDGQVVGVDYTRLTAVLIEAVKEQQVEIQKLKAEVRRARRSQSSLASLEARLARLEAKAETESTTHRELSPPAYKAQKRCGREVARVTF